MRTKPIPPPPRQPDKCTFAQIYVCLICGKEGAASELCIPLIKIGVS